VKVLPAAFGALAMSLCAVSAAPNPLDDLQECSDRMQPGHARGKKLAEQCPNLDATLEALGLSRLLDTEQRERLNSQAIDDLVALSSQYSAARPAVGPSVSTLTAIAEQVNGRKAAAPLGWWDRLKAWVKDWLSRPGTSGKSWFDEWLRRMADSTALLNAILYVCMGTVIAGALLVVFIEMRAAGVLRRKEARLGAGGPHASSTETLPGAAAEARGGVPRLLGLRLQFERTLTHRELIARSIFDTPEQRGAFAQVSQAAEALLYGGAAEAAIPQPVMDLGSSLLAQLTDLPAKAAS